MSQTNIKQENDDILIHLFISAVWCIEEKLIRRQDKDRRIGLGDRILVAVAVRPKKTIEELRDGWTRVICL